MNVLQAFESASGVAPDALRYTITGLIGVGYIAYLAWVAKAAQSAWADERIKLKDLIVTLLRAVVVVTVFITYMATTT